METPPNTSKPQKVQAIAIMSLISGIVNIGFGIFWIILGLKILLVGVLFTGIPGICCLIIGILNVSYSSRLFSAKSPPVKPAQYLTVLDILSLLFFNWISCILGAINLALYGDKEVNRFFQIQSEKQTLN